MLAVSAIRYCNIIFSIFHKREFDSSYSVLNSLREFPNIFLLAVSPGEFNFCFYVITFLLPEGFTDVRANIRSVVQFDYLEFLSTLILTVFLENSRLI